MTKQILRSLILIFLLLPSSAYAFLSIEIFSIGILSVNIEIPFVAALLGAGIASIFGGFFSSVSYGYAPPPIIEQKHTLSVTIGEPRKKEVLELMNGIRDFIQNDKIQINEHAYLTLEDDGKMRFHDTTFQGYLMLHNDNSLTVWNKQNQILLVITRKDNNLYVLQKQNCDCAELMNILFQNRHV